MVTYGTIDVSKETIEDLFFNKMKDFSINQDNDKRWNR